MSWDTPQLPVQMPFCKAWSGQTVVSGECIPTVMATAGAGLHYLGLVLYPSGTDLGGGFRGGVVCLFVF